jgi:adenosylcobinamide-GDP ribazoletransferase
MRYMMCAFPLVGGVIGLLVWGWCKLSASLEFGAALRAAGITVIPVAVTGGIHLDGLCDVADALAGGADAPRRREILKDPRVGSFAVIRCACYFTLYFALGAEFAPDAPGLTILCLTFVLSRTLSALAVLSMAPGSDTGLAAAFRSSADIPRARVVLCLILVSCCCVFVAADAVRGVAASAAMLPCILRLKFAARRKFGGMSGDLAGWFLQLCELAALAALVVAPRLSSLL